MTATIELFRNADYCIDFPAGHTIFEKGQSGDVMYVVIAGQVDVLIQPRSLTPSDREAYWARWR
jgi:CRP-like cAMP-binding protein